MSKLSNRKDGSQGARWAQLLHQGASLRGSRFGRRNQVASGVEGTHFFVFFQVPWVWMGTGDFGRRLPLLVIRIGSPWFVVWKLGTGSKDLIIED